MTISVEKTNNAHCVTPILQSTLTDWSNLYSAIVAASKLNQNIGHSQKPIVTLDMLQLYMKYIQLESVGKVNQDWLFQLSWV